MIKYILRGGYIISKTDRQEHYVSARELLHLYQLKREECLLIDEGETYKLLGMNCIQYKCLDPRYDGNYQLETV